jgi:hypothetical protein
MKEKKKKKIPAAGWTNGGRTRNLASQPFQISSAPLASLCVLVTAKYE